MAGFLSENTPILDALDGADHVRLSSSDQTDSSLNFRCIQADIEESLNIKIDTAAPEGMHGIFNCSTADKGTPPPASGQTPVLVPELTEKQTISYSNG
ncbi:MAG: hypothetical protein CO093_11630 [Alphaproteobacteria bacterium CG_4_9_14_3_um_filter_47_13]|nr:MAG: hypothetical protein CO093_11630 [Alphaproteobacteria bacterium CG_4_9_14_3_um_filter_47_13]